jgi:polyisoprenoid-binding protein YceI
MTIALATATTTWNIDPVHTTAEFKVKQMMITNVTGQFTAVTGSVQFGGDDVTNSHVEATIDLGSCNTRHTDRDAHHPQGRGRTGSGVESAFDHSRSV